MILKMLMLSEICYIYKRRGGGGRGSFRVVALLSYNIKPQDVAKMGFPSF